MAGDDIDADQFTWRFIRDQLEPAIWAGGWPLVSGVIRYLIRDSARIDLAYAQELIEIIRNEAIGIDRERAAARRWRSTRSRR